MVIKTPDGLSWSQHHIFSLMCVSCSIGWIIWWWYIPAILISPSKEQNCLHYTNNNNDNDNDNDNDDDNNNDNDKVFASAFKILNVLTVGSDNPLLCTQLKVL